MNLKQQSRTEQRSFLEEYYIDKITDMDRIVEIKELWQDLQHRCEIDIPFNTYDWYHIWWESFQPDNEFSVYVVYLDNSRNKICAVLPMYRSGITKRNKAILSTWSNTHSFRTGILCDKDHYHALDLLLSYLNSDLSWENIHIPYLVADNETELMLKKALSRQKLRYLSQPGMSSPVLEIKGAWDDYFNQFGRSTRESLRRKTRNILEKTNGRAEIICGINNDLDSKLNKCWQISRKTWKQKIGSSIAYDNSRMKFYEEIACSPNGWIVLAILYLRNEPIAFEYNLLYKGTLYNLKLGYDEDYSKLSPGVVLRLKMLEWAFSDERVKNFDFMGNAAEYKLMFSTHQLTHNNITIYSRSMRHTLYVFYKGKLRPILARNLRPIRNVIKCISKHNDG